MGSGDAIPYRIPFVGELPREEQQEAPQPRVPEAQQRAEREEQVAPERAEQAALEQEEPDSSATSDVIELEQHI